MHAFCLAGNVPARAMISFSSALCFVDMSQGSARRLGMITGSLSCHSNFGTWQHYTRSSSSDSKLLHSDTTISSTLNPAALLPLLSLLVYTFSMNSTLRNQLLPKCMPTYAGYLAWRGIARTDDLSAEVQHLLTGKATMFKVCVDTLWLH
jgi:hypothetical protein